MRLYRFFASSLTIFSSDNKLRSLSLLFWSCENIYYMSLPNFLPSRRLTSSVTCTYPSGRTVMPSLFAPCRRIHDKVFEVRAVGESLDKPFFFAPRFACMGCLDNSANTIRGSSGESMSMRRILLRLATDLDISLTGDDCGCES
jgi:hypothetical protein